MRPPLEIPPLTVEELEALEKLYRTTKDPRLRTRAQMVPAFWRAAAEGCGHCPHCARGDPNSSQLAQALDGRRHRRAERSTHARSSAQNHGRVSRALAGSGPAPPTQPGATLFDVDVAALGGLYGRANRHPSVHRNRAPGAQSGRNRALSASAQGEQP